MNPLCYDLLTGSLWSAGTPIPPAWLPGLSVNNHLPIPVALVPVPAQSGFSPSVSGTSQRAPAGVISDIDASPGYYAVAAQGTGGLITVLNITGPGTYDVAPHDLSLPNDAGPIPVPTSSVPAAPIQPAPAVPRPGSTVIVPADSPRVVVGCGIAANGNLVLREQYWERQSDSVCLAGKETRTVSFTLTQGLQQTSSTTDVVAATVGVNASAGWGPISASVSASLSTSTTRFQQVTVTQQTTTYVSHTIHNDEEEPVAYFRWQLTDVITIFDKTTFEPLSSFSLGESPIIVTGPYRISPPPASQAGSAKRAAPFIYR